MTAEPKVTYEPVTWAVAVDGQWAGDVYAQVSGQFTASPRAADEPPTFHATFEEAQSQLAKAARS